MKNMFKLMAVAALVSVSAGCMWGRMVVNDPTIADRAAYVRPGVTKADDLRGILRADPSMIMPGKKATTLGYTYSDTKANGLILILFNFTRSQTVAQTMYLEIDPATRVVVKKHVPSKREIEWRFWPFGGEEDD